MRRATRFVIKKSVKLLAKIIFYLYMLNETLVNHILQKTSFFKHFFPFKISIFDTTRCYVETNRETQFGINKKFVKL